MDGKVVNHVIYKYKLYSFKKQILKYFYKSD